MSFKIPPPWQPNYAIPAYVRAEGLRTRAFVTKWAPRGTYDDPDPHDPSWDKSLAVPQYIKDEGYGQGAMVTEWAPRGTYAGGVKPPAKPANGQKKTALGDFAGQKLPASYNRFGARAAQVILSRVAALPANQRKAAMKKILDAIDPDLWARSSQIAAELTASGVHPTTAVKTALARAMSEGAAREVVDSGKRRSAPSPHSVMGLGAWGPSVALGATAAFTSRAAAEAGTVKTPIATAPQVGDCRTDTRTGAVQIWRAASATSPAHWERAKTGEACRTSSSYTSTDPGPSGGVTVTTREGEVVTTKAPVVAPEMAVVPMMTVGPFSFPQDSTFSQIRWHGGPNHTPHYLPEAWQAELRRVLSSKPGVSTTGWQIDQFVSGLPASVNQSYIVAVSPDISIAKIRSLGSTPIFRAKHPVSGKDYGVFFGTSYEPTNVPMKDAQVTAHIIWAEIKREWYEDVWATIREIIVAIVDVGKAVLTEVSTLACQLATAADATAAGAAVGVAAGAGASTGAAGAAIVKAACYSPPPPPAPPASSSPDWLVPVAIGGAILAGVVFLLPKKRKSP